MDILVESIEYYYDEDFSIPFDIGITEENNNANIDLHFQPNNVLKYADLSDNEENDTGDDLNNEDFIRVILSPDIFNEFKPMKNNYNQNKPKFTNNRHKYSNEFKRPDSTVRMSCSSTSSPISSVSMATNHIEKGTLLHVDTQNMSFNESIYSLKSRVPLFNNRHVLANYHLDFTANDSLLNSSFVSLNGQINPMNNRSQLCNLKSGQKAIDLIDSGKCSGNTADSIFQQLNREQNTLFNRLNLSQKFLKPESILWRQIKFFMNHYYTGWKLLNIFLQFRKKVNNQSSSTDEIIFYRLDNNSRKRKQSYSCSVLEVYNSVMGKDKLLIDNNTKKLLHSQNYKNKSLQNFSCQFPPKINSHYSVQKQNSKDLQNPSLNTLQRMNATHKTINYPGIGKINMPKPTRLSSSAFFTSNLHSNLSFLQSSFTSHHSDITCNRPHGDSSGSHTPPPLSLCSLNCHLNGSNNNKSNKSDSPLAFNPYVTTTTNDVAETLQLPKQIICKPKPNNPNQSSSSMVNGGMDIFKRKSVSFDCPEISSESSNQEMKEIPKKWGLLGAESALVGDMLAVFECGGRKDISIGGAGKKTGGPGEFGFGRVGSVKDDAARFKSMVNGVIRSVKQISDRLSVAVSCNEEASNKTRSGSEINNQFQTQLTTLCEKISIGDGLESPLSTAIDNLIVLMSDGLVESSFTNKRKVRISSTSTNKVAIRLWSLIEETCRNPTNQSNSPKAELAQLLKEVRQTVGNIVTNVVPSSSSSSSSSTKDHQLKLRAFIASALKMGLLHVWIRSVVANETALQRFYCPEAFLRQARCSQSDALSALTISLKTLTSIGPSTLSSSSSTVVGTVTTPSTLTTVAPKNNYISSSSSTVSKITRVQTEIPQYQAIAPVIGKAPPTSLPPPIRISRRFFSSPPPPPIVPLASPDHQPLPVPTTKNTVIHCNRDNYHDNNHHYHNNSHLSPTHKLTLLYSEDNTESESCADNESRSSQSEYPLPAQRDVSNNNNIVNNNHSNEKKVVTTKTSIFSRVAVVTHPRIVKKSQSSNLQLLPSSSPLIPSEVSGAGGGGGGLRNPIKSLTSNQNNFHFPIQMSTKQVRLQEDLPTPTTTLPQFLGSPQPVPPSSSSSTPTIKTVLRSHPISSRIKSLSKRDKT